MMFLSVLLITITTLDQFQCIRLIDDIDNEVSGDPTVNIAYNSWLKITQAPSHVVTKKVGAHLELHCEAMGSPPPTIEWYKRNRKITENESFEPYTVPPGTAIATVQSRLVINHLLPRHQDVYRCVAQGGARVATAASKVVVANKEGREMNLTQLLTAKILGAHHLPRVTLWASTYLDVIGNDVLLPCKFVGNPKPYVIWSDPNGTVIENDERYSISQEGELRIRSIAWSDHGPYTCSLENSVGVDSVETFLYPMEKPSK
ncbi:unnamed protein product [Phaedon cochleariae]|uniref:Ig-like domain-containing protein n=1 Tax=Phaedon cochleariae TaxID=80249 RepID=A0A9P0DEV5_PHACE|nr:unnamed protein product [Phaedon cochleariae]